MKSSWEVSPVWELKMHIMVEELEEMLVGWRWFFEKGVIVGAEGNVFMRTSLFLLLVNQRRGSSLHLLHWLKTKGHTQISHLTD